MSAPQRREAADCSETLHRIHEYLDGEMTAEDIAETILWIANLPPHLNINRLELMPVSQSFAGFQVARG